MTEPQIDTDASPCDSSSFFFLCVLGPLRDNCREITFRGTVMPEEQAGTDPTKPFLEHILRRYQELRGKDTLPETVEAWTRHKEILRRTLVESWGGFPRDACDLAPKKLGEIVRDGYRVEKIVFQTRPGVLMTANAYIPDGPGKQPPLLAIPAPQ